MLPTFFFFLSPFLLLPVMEFYHRKDVDRSLIYITSKSSKFFILFLSTQHFFRHSWMFIKYWGEEFKFHGMDCASNVVWYDADAFLCKFQQQFFFIKFILDAEFHFICAASWLLNVKIETQILAFDGFLFHRVDHVLIECSWFKYFVDFSFLYFFSKVAEMKSEWIWGWNLSFIG